MIGDIGAHLLSYHFHLVEQEIDEVFCMLDTSIPAHAAPVAAGGFQLDAKGDRGRMIPNTTDDVATVLYRFGGGAGAATWRRAASRPASATTSATTSSAAKARCATATTGSTTSTSTARRARRSCAASSASRWARATRAFAAFHPVSGLGLGYNDFKAMEARDFLVAVAEGKPAYPDFRWATASSAWSTPA